MAENCGELLVHRVRFLQTRGHPIHRLAFSGEHVPRLAVARGDCSIELWTSKDGARYYKQRFVPGRRDVSIEALVWIGKRLFSAGLTGSLLAGWLDSLLGTSVEFSLANEPLYSTRTPLYSVCTSKP